MSSRFNNFAYYLFKGVEGVVRATPFCKKFYIKAIGEMGYRLDRWRKKVVLTNLQLAFPHLTPQEREELARQVYLNFARILVEFIESKRFKAPSQLERLVELDNLEELKEVGKEQVIFVTAHFGNWELIPLVLGGFVTPLTIVARELENPHLNREIVEHRQKFGVEVVYKKGAIAKLVRRLREGRSIGLLPDQNTAKWEGVETRWFGKRVLQTPSPVQLALRFKLPIVVLFSEPTPSGKWKIVIRDRFRPDSVEEGVNRLAKVMEEEISRFPAHYFWFHKRFKHFYEEAYR